MTVNFPANAAFPVTPNVPPIVVFPVMLAVPVAVKLDVVAPPYKVTACDVTAPRPVTVCSVSLSAKQFVPSTKQTAFPTMKSEFRFAEDPVAFVNVR